MCNPQGLTEKDGLYHLFYHYDPAGRGEENLHLGHATSKDLIHWEIVDTILVDRQMLNDSYSMWAHAFQYVDFVVEGNDIYFLVREAVDDCYHYHDANYITMYKIDGYVEFVKSRV